MMDHDKLACELVQALRGRRSQTALSRRLGYSTNVVYTWEAGRRFPTASDFMQLALRSGVDVPTGLARFWGSAAEALPSDWTGRAAITRLLALMRKEHKLAELARRTGISRLTLAGWLEGKAEPRLPELLKVVEATTQRLLDFVAVFMDPARLPGARGAWRDMEAQRRVAYELPWSHAVLRALELQGPGAPTLNTRRMAAQLGITEAHQRECLRALEQAKQIRRTRRGYRVTRVLTVDTRAEPEKNRALKAHWLRVALERLEHGDAGVADDLSSYSLFAISNADYERIRAAHAAYFEQVRSIARASSKPERVVLASLQLTLLTA